MIRKRRIEFFGEVNAESCMQAGHLLFGLWEESNDDPIDLIIASPGGAIPPALGLYDTIVYLTRAKVRTIALGEVDSAAILIFMSGTERVATPHTRFLFHEIGRAFDKTQHLSADAIRRIYEETAGITESYAEIVAQRSTKISESQVIKLMEEERYLSAQEAKRTGIVHCIIGEDEDVESRESPRSLKDLLE